MPYNLEEHRHRFSAWAAARAAQRGFTSVDILREALEQCGIRRFLKSDKLDDVSDQRFRQMHEEWCGSIVKYLQKELKLKKPVSEAIYGRAAKLVAMYIKSMVVIGGQSESSFAKAAHPPIDGILIKNISQEAHLPCLHNDALRKVKWTQLNRKEYYELVGQLHKCSSPGEPFWMLERYWNVYPSLAGERSGQPRLDLHRN